MWARYNQSNDGTALYKTNQPDTYDIGIRRFRIQFFGQLTDRVFIYSQLGVNNFSYNADRKSGGTPGPAQAGTGGFFLHDAVGEYVVVKQHLALGMGLTGWAGLTRFSAPSAGTILGVDAPLVEQTTNDATDQFLRKLAIYAKGKVGKLDYRVAVADPLVIQKATVPNVFGPNACFSTRPPQAQYTGYVNYQFFDQESNLTPYGVGTYLGRKRVLNVGAGALVQPEAMWYQSGTDTLTQALKQFAIDAYYDAPLDTAKGGPSLSFYAAALHLDYGPGYLRNNAVMNPAAGGTVPANVFNGPGNGWPTYGTGNTFYAQAGYKFKDNLLGETTFMPYLSYQYSKYKRLADDLHYFDAGVSWLLAGHTSKLTFSYQNRPVYITQPNGDITAASRKSGCGDAVSGVFQLAAGPARQGLTPARPFQISRHFEQNARNAGLFGRSAALLARCFTQISRRAPPCSGEAPPQISRHPTQIGRRPGLFRRKVEVLR